MAPSWSSGAHFGDHFEAQFGRAFQSEPESPPGEEEVRLESVRGAQTLIFASVLSGLEEAPLGQTRPALDGVGVFSLCCC